MFINKLENMQFYRPMRKNNEVTLSDILPPESKNELYPSEKPIEASNNENKSVPASATKWNLIQDS